MEPLTRIQQLKARFTDPAFKQDAEQIQQWERDLKNLIAREKLLENESLIIIIKKLAQEISDMKELLNTADSNQLPDKDRDRVLDRKNLYLQFIALFDAKEVAKQIRDIDEEVAANLESLPPEINNEA